MKKTKICPMCGHDDILALNEKFLLFFTKQTNISKCRKCGHQSSDFPEVDEHEIEEYRKRLASSLENFEYLYEEDK
ncbi:hypothetical protein JW930_06850 [Candidatus Woesearchaeota archaeon]|nr:hypothetical protein [Candidatus Woesearchaeota archaeon]